MLKRTAFLLLTCFTVLFFATSCQQPIELPEGVQVLIDGESIEGDKVVMVSQGADVPLQITGLQSTSNVNFKVKKAGIKVHEEDFVVGSEGAIDEMISLPDIQLQVTAVVNFTDWSGVTQEMSFIIKLR